MEDKKERLGTEVSEKESARLSFKGGRGFLEYKKNLRFDESDLKGKRILDLGASPADTFAREVEQELSGTKVVTFGFDVDKTDGVEQAQAVGQEGVKGLFTKLPFEDASFDVVVSSAAMPLYLTNEEQIRESFQEVVRVLKSGGKAFIGPVSYTKVVDPGAEKVWDRYEKHPFDESKELFTRILESLGGQIDFEFIPAETSSKLGWGEFEEKIVKPTALLINKK